MKWLKGCLAAALLMWLGAVAQGTQFAVLPIEKLAERAQLILQGKVLSKTTLRDEKGRIYTKIELQVDEVWKGGLATNRFTIVQGGGTLGERRVEVSGQVEYAIGEEVVAFLVLNARGEGVTLGLAQGKFEIWRESATGQRYVRNVFHGRDNPPAANRGQRQAAGAASPALTVGDLKQRVQDASK
jgi:hypothetical protein